MKLADVLLRKHNTPPIWLMRQAGRYLPEYRAIRQNYDDFLSFCYAPQDASTVTLHPIQRFDLDAAIIFSDILVIPDALGQRVFFEKDHGPKLTNFSKINLDQAHTNNWIKKLAPVYDAIHITRSKLDSNKSLIGFAGTPWTLACYMLEEGKSTNFNTILNYQHNDRYAFMHFIDVLTHCVTQHIRQQIEAGCDVIQLFDSWAIKAPYEYFTEKQKNKTGFMDTQEAYILNPIQKIINTLHKEYPNVLIIYYSRCPEQLYMRMIETHKPMGPFGLSVWHEVSLTHIKSALKNNTTTILQGNLSPHVLEQGGDPLYHEAKNIVESMQNHPFIFNLGHGILKTTPPEHVANLVSYIRSLSHTSSDA